MAKLTSFVYCLNVERIKPADGQGENINAMGLLTALIPEYIPGTFSFSIAFSVLDIDVASSNNNIRIVFLRKDGDLIVVDSGIINLPKLEDPNEISIPNEFKGLNMSMDLRNVVFEKEGVYTTKIYFNGDLLHESPIYVKGKRKLS